MVVLRLRSFDTTSNPTSKNPHLALPPPPPRHPHTSYRPYSAAATAIVSRYTDRPRTKPKSIDCVRISESCQTPTPTLRSDTRRFTSCPLARAYRIVITCICMSSYMHTHPCTVVAPPSCLLNYAIHQAADKTVRGESKLIYQVFHDANT